MKAPIQSKIPRLDACIFQLILSATCTFAQNNRKKKMLIGTFVVSTNLVGAKLLLTKKIENGREQTSIPGSPWRRKIEDWLSG